MQKKDLTKKETIRKVFGWPSSTVHHSRLPVFAATRRPVEKIQWIWENPWGTVSVTGRLGQNHRDLHDLIMSEGTERSCGKEGELYLTIDPSDINKKLGLIDTHSDYIYDLMEDMRRAKVEIEYKRGGGALGGIISNIDHEYKTIPGPGGCVPKRYLWRITMNQTWMKLYDREINICCKPALDMIMSMRSGYSQAIARFFLTHGEGMTLDFSDCLLALGIEREARFVRRDIKEDMPLLADLGIEVTSDRKIIYTRKQELVSFYSPNRVKKVR